MRTFARCTLLPLLLCPAAAYNCTGKPRTFQEVRAIWRCDEASRLLGACSYDRTSRPNVARRWEGVPDEGATPPEKAPPEDVWVVLQVNSLRDVDTRDQTYSIEVYLRVFWFDYRLAYDGECVSLGAVNSLAYDGFLENEIWVPDVFTPTAHTPPVISKNSFWIAPTGRVWWARRMTWTLSCKMDFSKMPFDTQLCNVKVTGFRDLGTEVVFHVPNGTDLGPDYDFTRAFTTPVRAVCPDSGTVEWDVLSITGEEVYGGSVALVPFSFAEYHFSLSRQRGYYTHYVLLPMILLVIITWSSFFISRSAVPARVSMVIIACTSRAWFEPRTPSSLPLEFAAELAFEPPLRADLNMSSLLSSTNHSLPHLSGSVWLLEIESYSLMFLFVAIIEYAMTNYVSRLETRVTTQLGVACSELRRKKAEKEEMVNATRMHVSPPVSPPDIEGASTTPAVTTPAVTTPAVMAAPMRPRPCLRKTASMSEDQYVKGLAAAAHGLSDIKSLTSKQLSSHVGSAKLSSSRRHSLMAAARSNLISKSHADIPLTRIEIMSEMKAICGVQERAVLENVTKEGEGWVPVLRITADKLDKNSRFLFPLACECSNRPNA